MCEVAVVLVAVFLYVALGGELNPQFNQTPEHVTVVAGNRAILPCTVKFLGEHTVIWSSPRKTLISHADRRMIDDHRISVERPYIKEWNLHIRDVRYNDSGVYKCEINTKPIQAKLVNLSVYVPPMIIGKYSSDHVVINEGETVELLCNVTGVPQPNVTWFKRNSRRGKGYREQIGLQGGALLIHNVSRYCDDIYDCFVENGIPPSRSKAIKVEVLFAPEVVLTNKRIGQRRGKETILECVISAHPHSITVWKRNGQKITQKSDKYSIDAYEDRDDRTVTLSLRIMNLEDEDFGAYTCEGSNPLGEDSEQMVLYAIEPETTTTTTTTTTTYGPSYEIGVEETRNVNQNVKQNVNDRQNMGTWDNVKPRPTNTQSNVGRRPSVPSYPVPEVDHSRTITDPGSHGERRKMSSVLTVILLALTVVIIQQAST